MKKNRFLWALALSSTCLFGLVACQGNQGIQGEKGEKGDTGAQGEKGEKGDTGATGEKGDKGEKGDQGEKGDKGDKGDTGATGATGAKGDTAWGNTILPSDGGYVTADVGSAVKGSKVKFEIFIDDDDYKLDSVTLNTTEYTLTSSEYKINYDSTKDNYYIETKMVEGGFVVKADFSEIDDNTKIINLDTGVEYTKLEEALSSKDDGGTYRLLDDSTFAYEASKNAEKYAITKKNFVIDLNNHTLTSTAVFNLGKGLEKFSIIGKGTVSFTGTHTLTSDYDNYAINIGTISNEIIPEVTIGKDVTISSSTINGIYIRNHFFKENGLNKDDGKTDATLIDEPIKANVNIYGKINLDHADSTALKIDGKQIIHARENIQVNVYENSELTSKGNTIEMYDGTLNVSGGTIKGKTPLVAGFQNKNSYDELSGTVLNLKDGTFTSTDGESGTAMLIDYGVKYDLEAIKDNNAITGNLQVGYLEVSTADELISALKNTSFINVYLKNDIELNLNDSLTLSKDKKIYCRNYDLTIKLNGYNFNPTKQLDITDAKNLKITNEENVQSTISDKLKISYSSNVTVKNVKFNNGYCTDFSPDSYFLTDKTKKSVINFENVEFEGTTYGFSTYGTGLGTDHNLDDYTYNFTNCKFKGTSADFNNTACIFDSTCTYNLTGCEFTGDRQCLVVRSGDVSITNCKFNYSGKSNEAVSWGYDNNAENAMIVVGNSSSSSYKWGAAKLTLADTNEFNIDQDCTKNLIYVINDGKYNVEVNMTSAVSAALLGKAYVADSSGSATTVIKVGGVEQVINDNKWEAPAN